jgi:quercetin dioxygenase-like cupin family protein
VDPRVVRPDEAHQVRLNQVVFDYGLRAADTDGQVSMLQVTIPPKTLIKPHTHGREDEFTLILAGTGRSSTTRWRRRTVSRSSTTGPTS